MVDKLKFLKGKIKEYIKFNIIGTSNFLVSQVFYIILFMVFYYYYDCFFERNLYYVGTESKAVYIGL